MTPSKPALDSVVLLTKTRVVDSRRTAGSKIGACYPFRFIRCLFEKSLGSCFKSARYSSQANLNVEGLWHKLMHLSFKPFRLTQVSSALY